MDKKVLDIITINLDNKEGLELTINSVINQTFFDMVNFIIIDGGSKDGSKELIEQYKDKLYYWISEKDKGIYNAMNKGLKVAVSHYCLFLNSGDYLSDEKRLETIFPYLDGKYDLVYCNEYKKHKEDEKIRDPFEWCKGQFIYKFYTQHKWHVHNPLGTLSKYPDELTEDFFKNTALPHQSTFIKTKLLKKHPYDEHYKIISDWKFLREAWADGCKYLHVPIPMSVFNLDGFSVHNLPLMWKEKKDYYSNLNLLNK